MPDIVVKQAKPNSPPESDDFGVRMIHRGLNDIFKIYRASFKRVFNDILVLTSMIFAHITYILELAVADMNGVKAHLRLAPCRLLLLFIL